jgi:putative ABC transport system permease protein
MSRTLYLAWRYLRFHPFKTGILVTSIALILFLPVGLRVLVDQSSQQLTARAAVTPLVIGSKGSLLELVLNTLYFRADYPEPMTYAEVERVEESGMARAIPMYVRFQAQSHPIVGTSLDYFDFRGLKLASGRQMALLGECVVGARAAATLGVGPGDAVVSSPESVFDLTGVYPLKMNVAGVLAFSDGPDDDAVFVDLKTTWVVQGLVHGHADLSKPESAAGVLSRDGDRVIANASVVQFNAITEDNIDSFHFHGDLSSYPITAVIVVPPDARNSALLQGRYQSEEEVVQVAQPVTVMDELLATVLTIQRFVVAGAVIVGLATLASAALVFMLSLRLRRRERETLFKIGGSRLSVASVMASEIILVLTAGIAAASALTLLVSRFGAVAVRALIRM